MSATASQHVPNLQGSRIARGSAACMAAHVVYLAIRFLIAPIVLVAVGLEAFGFWALVFAMLGLLGIHRMGVLGAATSYVARYHAAGEHWRIERLLRTGASIALVIAVVLGSSMWLFHEQLLGLMGVPSALMTPAAATLLLAAIVTLIAMVLGGYQSILEALQEHPKVRLIDTLAAVLEAGIICLLLWQDFGLLSLAIAYAVRVLLPVAILARMASRRMPGISALPGRLDRVEAGRLLRFGGAIQLLGILHIAIGALDRIVLANVVSLAAAGALELARKLVSFAGALPVHGMAPVAPAAARLRGLQSDHRELRTLLGASTWVVAVLTAVPVVFLVVFGGPFLRAWVGPGFEEAVPVLQILCAASYFHLLTGPLTAVLRGLAQPKLEVMYTACWLGTAVVLVPVGAHFGGLLGVAIASAVAQVVGVTIFLSRAVSHLGLSWANWLRQASTPLVVAVAVAAAIDLCLPMLKDPTQELGLLVYALVGLGMGLITVALVVAVGLNAAERAKVLARWRRAPRLENTLEVSA